MQHAALWCALALFVTAAPAQPAESIDNLAWLAGDWKLEAGGKVIEEHWTAPAGGTMIGMSRTVANGKTVSFEFLRVEQRGDGIVYLAQPQGKPATEFRLVRSAGGEWAFENPEHDFPKRILYRRNPDGSVTARIEDETGKKGVDFPYKRP